MRKVGPVILAAVALAAVFLGSFLVGRYPVAPGAALGILLAPLVPLDPWWPAEAATVVLKVRLPRILAAMMVGASLSCAGAAYQGVFRNPMVSPDILGVAAGAGLGAALAILWGLGGPGIQLCAFAGGLAAVGAAYAIGVWQGRSPGAPGGGVLVLVLAGVIVGTVFSAGISLAKFAADPNNTLPAITFWLMGSLASVSSGDLAWAAPPMAAGLLVLLALRWRLNVLAFGDEEARTLGINAAATRAAVVAAATLMTAASVAVAGVIGLVGLIVPHLARLMVGPNHRVLLPVCGVLGAAFLLAVDDLARGLIAGEVPLGILTAFLGAPFFIALLVNAGRGWAP